MWVRRASAVALIPSFRRGLALDVAYDLAKTLHPDREDLIHKAVGWMLREAGKLDPARLERYLRAEGPAIPRTTVRYAIERFPRQSAARFSRVRARPGDTRVSSADLQVCPDQANVESSAVGP
jgi:3-methyladenine DNA glycosylase AlkD